MPMNVQCPKCFNDKPLGAKYCPHCVQRITNGDVAKNELGTIFWMVIIIAVIWNIIT
jgi:hypothetical protein